ncbi:MAG TPA: DUF3786 domain-containing protein [Desulfobacteraceae bacterium]|nr:DUF3786 domain-containing protein [Desulfobacteraceae bacterium]
MTVLDNPVEILKLLDKSNCGECGEKTCLAFAGAVFQRRRSLAECPRVDRKIVESLKEEDQTEKIVSDNREEAIEEMKKEVQKLDLPAVADRIGGKFSNGRLTVKILGKDFSVDAEGNLHSEIHINPWVAGPFLDYVIRSAGVPPTGNWVSLRELDGGRAQYPLFKKRCEEPMKKVADESIELFDHIVHVFNGKEVDPQFQSDVSVVLRFLPLVPAMICYWSPAEGMGSSLNVFFDETAGRNLSIGSIFSLGAGFSQMIQKVAWRHM